MMCAPPVGAGAEHVPLLASVLRPRSVQFVALSAAAPDVVIERSTSHVAVLAAPSEMVAGVSTPIPIIVTMEDEEDPVAVSALVMV